MTAPTSAKPEHLCTLAHLLPFVFAQQLLTVICTTAEEYGYTDVRVASDGRIVATPPRRSGSAVLDPDGCVSAE